MGSMLDQTSHTNRISKILTIGGPHLALYLPYYKRKSILVDKA